MASLTKSEEAVLLASTQAALISTPDCSRMSGNAPELLSVGHNPFPCDKIFHNAITLPSQWRRKTLIEFLYETSLEHQQSQTPELVGMVRRKQLERLVRSWKQAGSDREIVAYRPYIRGDTSLGAGTGRSLPYGVHLVAADSEYGLVTGFSLKGGLNSGKLASGRQRSVDKMKSTKFLPGLAWPTGEFNPHKITAFMEGLSVREQKVLAAQRFTEYFYESRVAALER